MNKKLSQKLELDLRKEFIDVHKINVDDPELIKQRLMKSIEEPRKEIVLTDREKEDMIKYDLSQTLDNQMLLRGAVSPENRSYMIQLIKDMQNEYSCTKAAEKLVIHNIVINYLRMLTINSKVVTVMSKTAVGKLEIDYLKALSKELDNANKQYSEATRLLMQMKMKPLNVNIKTHNAVFGQNQAINMGDKDNLLTENH